MVTTGILPSRDTCTSLYIVGEGREQDAEASPARIAARTPFLQVIAMLRQYNPCLGKHGRQANQWQSNQGGRVVAVHAFKQGDPQAL